MKKFIEKLPIDIVFRIIPYTYRLQNKDLLYDIINYKKTKTILFDLYYDFWIVNMHSQTEEDLNWLINDLFSYANDYNATMYGYVDKFYNIFRRNRFLQTNEQIDHYVFSLEKRDVSTQINIFLGLLKVYERNDIIRSFIETNETIFE